MDTAKAANLYATYPADFLAYVNPPIGRGQPVPGKTKPLIAIPTTAGTGSETTGVAIFDLTDMQAKTGIASRMIRPLMGIVDPLNTLNLPPMVTACSGLDVICHALESLTALPYHQRPAPESPRLRPAYQGANPISQIWASKAVEMGTKNLLRLLDHPDDQEARAEMMLAATYAGIGFGNAGVTLPHGMSYPVSGKVRQYVPPDYPDDHPIIPHGMSVILNAPAVFRFTAQSNPQLHLYAASLMGEDISEAGPEQAGDLLGRRGHQADAQVRHPEWIEGSWIYFTGCRDAGRRHSAAAPGDQIVGTTRHGGRSRAALHGFNDHLVAWLPG